MSIFGVEVDIALSRPPKIDQTVLCVVESPNGVEAELLACQIAQARQGVVMAVGSRVVDWSDDPHAHAAEALYKWHRFVDEVA